MLMNQKILAVIPARGNSKGLHRKNLQPLCGVPLLGWTINAAKKSIFIDKLILSSEDEEIIAQAMSLGCEVPFKRPKELALDTTPGIEPLLHAIELLPNYDWVVLLQPTSPLRTTEDIDQCLLFFQEMNACACVSVVEEKANPYWMYTLSENKAIIPLLSQNATITRRQDLPPVFRLNGAIYVAKTDWLLRKKTFITDETVAYSMCCENSIDIDTKIDFRLAEITMAERLANPG